jgi:hypothetical protein
MYRAFLSFFLVLISMGRFFIEDKEEERINCAHAKSGKDVNDMPHRAGSSLPRAFLGLSPRSAMKYLLSIDVGPLLLRTLVL